MSNARQTLSGSELVFMPRNLAKPSPALGPYFTGISAWTPSSRRCSRSDTANFTFTNLVERSTTNAPAFTAGEMLRPVGEVNGISAPQSRKVTDPLPRGNADPLDRSLAMALPPSGNWGRPLTGFRRTPRANVVRCHTPRRWLRPLLDPDPLEFLFALASLEVG